ncbi:MAG: DMT family transporter [Pseudomonadota bacterium]|nr:DMT family transporter [Pseudomonadota bacterium]
MKHWEGYLFALGAVSIWSGFILVSRFGGMSQLQPWDMMAIRYGTCSLILLPVWLIWWRFPVWQPRFLISASLGGLAYALCVFQGFESAPASHAAVLLPGTMPLFIALISQLSGQERLTPIRWLGIFVISLSILLLFSQLITSTQGMQWGHLWFVAAAFFWSLYSVLLKHWQISPSQSAISLALVTALFYLPVYGLFIDTSLNRVSLSELLLQAGYQGVLAAIVQILLYVQAVRRIGPSAMGAMMAAIPLISGLAATVVFAEPLTGMLVICLALVSLGVVLANIRRTRARSR